MASEEATSDGRRRVLIVLLGELDQAPRTRYHALALAREAFQVDVLAFGATLPPDLASEPRIRVHSLGPPSVGRHRLPRPLYLASAAWRAVRLALRLATGLWRTVERSQTVLLQVPPALPTLPVALAVGWWRGANVVVDWHNFTAALLGQHLGPRHPAVALVGWLERKLGPRAAGHLCVSEAMREELRRRVGVEAAVLRDGAPEGFAPAPANEDRIGRARQVLPELPWEALAPVGSATRPALVVSSTSWTADEDFELLRVALGRLEARIRGRTFPPVVLVITGRGERRAGFERWLQGAALSRVHVCTAWLPQRDYARLLGAADLGLSLHRAASGVDLAMKVADMQASGLPVCALDHGPALAEQVRHGVNGLVFSTAEELAAQLDELFATFPDRAPLLDRLRATVLASSGETWAHAWARSARPILLRA